MPFRPLSLLCRAILAGGLGLTMASCGSTNPAGPGGKISKVKYYHLRDHAEIIPASDPAVPFERDYHLRGAVSTRDREARQGHYYAVLWKASDRTQPVTVRLEYRQQNTGMTVHKVEQEVADVHRSNKTEFQVIGPDYATNGAVTSWRATLVRGKDTLAEAKSYLWD